jgi:hypothetical protein
MRRLGARLLVIATLCSAVLVTPAASAGGFNGGCLLTLHFDFTTPISSGGGSGPYTISGGGTCVVSGLQAPAAVRNASFSGSGTAQNAKCAPLQLSGSYLIITSPSPSPPASSGIFSLNGTAAGGAWLMTGSNPQFDGVGVAVIATGLTDCVQGGASSLTVQVLLGFLDP